MVVVVVLVVVVVASLCYFPKTRDKTKHIYAIVSDKKQSKLHTMLFCLAPKQLCCKSFPRYHAPSPRARGSTRLPLPLLKQSET